MSRREGQPGGGETRFERSKRDLEFLKKKLEGLVGGDNSTTSKINELLGICGGLENTLNTEGFTKKNRDFISSSIEEINEGLKELMAGGNVLSEDDDKVALIEESKKEKKDQENKKLSFEAAKLKFGVLVSSMERLGKVKGVDDTELEELAGHLPELDKLLDEIEKSLSDDSVDINKSLEEFDAIFTTLNQEISDLEKKHAVMPVEPSAVKKELSTGDEEWKKERGPKLEDAKLRARLLKRIIAKMLLSEQKYKLKPFIKIIDNSLDVAADDGAKFATVFEAQINRFEHGFKNLLSKVGDEAVGEFESQLAGNVPSWENKPVKVVGTEPALVPPVEKNKKEEVGEAPRELSVDERKERDQVVGEAQKKWDTFESVVKHNITKSEWADLSIYIGIIKSSLYEAGITKFFDEYKTQMKRFDNIYPRLLNKVPEELKRKVENGEVPVSVKKSDKKDAEPLKESKEQEREKYIKEKIGEVLLLEQTLRQIFYSKINKDKKKRDFQYTADYRSVRTARDYLNMAQDALLKNDEAAYLENTKKASEQMNNVWEGRNSFGKIIKKKHQLEKFRDEVEGRSRGEETEGVKQEAEWREEGVKFVEDKLSFLEKTMDKHDKSLLIKFESEIKSIKDNLAEALANVKNADVWDENIKNAVSALDELAHNEIGQEVKDEYFGHAVDSFTNAIKKNKSFYYFLGDRFQGKKRLQAEADKGDTLTLNESLIQEINDYKTNLDQLVVEIARDIKGQDFAAEVQSIREAMQDAARAVLKFEDYESHFELLKEKMDDLSEKVADLKSKNTTSTESPVVIEGRKQEVEKYKLTLEDIIQHVATERKGEDFSVKIGFIKEIIEDVLKTIDNPGEYKVQIDRLDKEINILSAKLLEHKDLHAVTPDAIAGLEKEPSPEPDKNTLETPTTARISGDENLPSPDQQMLLQMSEFYFGVIEKVIQNSGNQEVIDGLKWRMEVVRTNIDKAKKEMSQHNKMDEVVRLNMQSLLEDLQKFSPKLFAELMQETTPQVVVAPAPEKKGFFARAKEKAVGFGKAIWNKETRNAAGKAAYDTVTTLFGVKIITDIVGGVFGKGDIVDYMEGRADSKKAIKEISGAYQDLLISSEKTKKDEALSENERIEKRIEFLKEKIGDANIQEEAKKQIIERLWAISIKHKTETTKSKKDRDEEVKDLLESYIHGKVSGVKIAKDALNFGFTITGLSLLRGAAYFIASYAEKHKQVRKEEAKDIVGSLKEKKSVGSLMKDVVISSVVETASSLKFWRAKEGYSGVARAMDFVKAFGTVARALGILNITVLNGGSTGERIDNLIQAVKNGDASIISDSFVQNAERVFNTPKDYGNYVELAYQKVTGQTEALETSIPKPVFELPKEETIVPKIETSVEAPIPEDVPFSVQNFAAEHKLSQESLAPLQKLAEQYPSLKEESLSRILDASKVGDGVKFHHADLVRGDVDTLIEAEGERRSVIFEELVKAKDYEGAAKYLESQDFSSRHKEYLSDYIGKGTHEDYLKFVAQYDEKPDKKMVYGLFRAMQGKGNTDLANAGFVRAATEDRTGRTVSLQGGELQYFGLNEKGEPILSGQGRVVVKETILAKITTSPTTISEVRVTDTPSVDDQLRLNADELRVMKDELPKHDETENALPVHMKDDAEREVLSQVESDKSRFAALGKEHVDVVERVRAGEPVGAYASSAAQHEAGQMAIQSENQNDGVQVVGEETTTEKTLVGKTIKTYTASGEVVQATAGTAQQEIKSAGTKNVEVASAVNSAKVVDQVVLEGQTIENLKSVALNYEAMGSYINARVNNFTFVGDGKDILNEQIINEPTVKSFKDYIKNVVTNNAASLDEKTVKDVSSMKQILDSFNQMDKNPEWYSGLKGNELKLFLDPNKNNFHMLANDNHIARITDQRGEEFILSDSDDTFVVKDDKLLRMDDGKVVEEYSYEEAVKLVKDMDEKQSEEEGKKLEEQSLRQGSK